MRLLADRDLGAGETELPESLQALIAARLDTLSPERKSLLQDAAVLGKVFWVGALAEIGGRDQDELELALHELARKELVRPARVSSMEGESEYSFWHLLVRDVAYGQIPRAERARRHRAAAAWIERKAGERVEDLAEVLAHHYLQALELAQAAGDTEQAEELARAGEALPRARGRAGARPRHRPGGSAARPRARALPGRRPGAAGAAPPLGRRRLPGRPPARGRGRARRGARPLPRPRRERGRSAGADPALPRHAPTGRGPTGRARRARPWRCSSRSRPARHSSLPTRSSPRRTSSRAPTARRSQPQTVRCALAETLGLPEPARAIGARGNARAYLGDPDGLAEMERALSLLIEQGEGSQAATTPKQPRHRPLPAPGACPLARRLRAGDRLLRAARPRRQGASRWRATARACSSSSAARRRRSSEPVRSRLPSRRAAQHGCLCGCARVELATHLARGEVEGASGIADWLVEAARTQASADVTVEVLAPVAAARLAAAAPDQARALLAEIEQTPGARDTPYYSRQLGAMLRTALAAGDPDLAQRLADGLEPRYPAPRARPLRRPRPARRTRRRHTPTPRPSTPKRPTRWQQFGNVPEHAYALLGQGRCLVALADPAAEQPLRQAAELFSSMGYRPALAETNALLEQTAAS